MLTSTLVPYYKSLNTRSLRSLNPLYVHEPTTCYPSPLHLGPLSPLVDVLATSMLLILQSRGLSHAIFFNLYRPRAIKLLTYPCQVNAPELLKHHQYSSSNDSLVVLYYPSPIFLHLRTTRHATSHLCHAKPMSSPSCMCVLAVLHIQTHTSNKRVWFKPFVQISKI